MTATTQDATTQAPSMSPYIENVLRRLLTGEATSAEAFRWAETLKRRKKAHGGEDGLRAALGLPPRPRRPGRVTGPAAHGITAEAIREALEAADGVVTHAALLLEVKSSTLWGWLNRDRKLAVAEAWRRRGGSVPLEEVDWEAVVPYTSDEDYRILTSEDDKALAEALGRTVVAIQSRRAVLNKQP